MHSPENKKYQHFLLVSLAGIQLTHILDFVIMILSGLEFFCSLLTFWLVGYTHSGKKA